MAADLTEIAGKEKIMEKGRAFSEKEKKEKRGLLKGICISRKRGIPKEEVDEAVLIRNWGIESDAHAGKWHRQVSLLSYEKIEDFRKKRCGCGKWSVW